MAKAAAKKVKQTTKLSRQDYLLVVQWIEDPLNRIKVEGSEKKVKLGARPCVKGKGFAELAKYVNDGQKKGSILKEVTGESMRTRYKTFCNKCRAVKVESQKTGFGITEADIAIKITTVAEKLEHLCPWYDRMDAIFGKSFKIRAPGKYDSGIDEEEGGQEFPWQDSNPEDNAEDITTNANLDSVVPDSLNPHGEDEVMDVLNAEGSEDDDQGEDLVGMENEANNAHFEHPVDDEGCIDRSDVETREEDGGRDPGAADNQRPGGSPPTVVVGRRSRSRSQSFGPENHYPTKKPLQETRNGINVAFANNLEAVSIQKGKANEIREKTFYREVERDDKRLAWDMQRSVLDREDKKEERKELMLDRKEDRDSRMSIAMVSSTRTVSEIEKIWEILKKK